ncbi:hypothetical protein BC938DRAFT_474391 [Jimgerdemannia flammicorona]|uniref:MRH domain-containing protein n=1 Tax=Jimgerdemannia flammicorona TaxID=994334 RepID=A0A433Q2C2_9FUNG|nr:hypothetical protein BC938DRAFT_474391 [Jimgerdemannia flammicorona]
MTERSRLGRFLGVSEKLLLEYKNGGECPNDSLKKHSTLISFICDANVAGLGHPVFVGDADKCSFWFEWATPIACAKSQGITTWGLFVTIIVVFTAVYCLGGVFYNRIVHSASGLDQIPNYEFWYNIYDWTKDMTIILAGTIFSFFSKPRSPSTYRGLPRDDEENTLIGEFEEES